jgi:hypothetical protein
MCTEKMMKASTYYFVVLAVLNGLAACVTPRLTGVLAAIYSEVLDGKPLPALTNLVVGWPWWPHVFCFLSLVGCAVSISTKIRSATLCHAIILGLTAELIWVFLVMQGFILPFVAIFTYIGR